MKFTRFNKKGMMDDLFDFLFTVFALVFLFLFVGFILNGSIENKHTLTVAKVQQARSQQNFLLLLQAPVFQDGVKLTTQEYTLQFLESRTVSRDAFTSAIVPQLALFFPESVHCGYQLILSEVVDTRTERLYIAEGKGTNINCPAAVLQHQFSGTKRYQLDLRVGLG